MALAEMRRQVCFANLAPGVLASTDRIVRHPLTHNERVAALRQEEDAQAQEDESTNT